MASDLVKLLRAAIMDDPEYGKCVSFKIEADTLEQAADRIEVLERVFDAAENVCIARGMGWDLDGVMDALNNAVSAINRTRALLGDAAP